MHEQNPGFDKTATSAGASANAYGDEAFRDKLLRHAKTAGKEIVEKALWLHYAARRADTPRWAKATIYGALGYFIMPLDAVPDITPFVGYVDDLGVLSAAFTTVAMYIDEDVKTLAAKKMRAWFGD